MITRETLIEKINRFEAMDEQTVANFNTVFSRSLLTWGNQQAEVEVLDIVGPTYLRRIKVDGILKEHMFLGELETTGEDALAAYEMRKQRRDTYQTNMNLENELMSEKEMALNPIEYFLLQYLRGSQTPYHTTTEISKKLGMCTRTIRTYLHKMEDSGIVDITEVPHQQCWEISIAENWN